MDVLVMLALGVVSLSESAVLSISPGALPTYWLFRVTDFLGTAYFFDVAFLSSVFLIRWSVYPTQQIEPIVSRASRLVFVLSRGLTIMFVYGVFGVRLSCTSAWLYIVLPSGFDDVCFCRGSDRFLFFHALQFLNELTVFLVVLAFGSYCVLRTSGFLFYRRRVSDRAMIWAINRWWYLLIVDRLFFCLLLWFDCFPGTIP